jgi:hypothetical protein
VLLKLVLALARALLLPAVHELLLLLLCCCSAAALLLLTCLLLVRRAHGPWTSSLGNDSTCNQRTGSQH